MKGIGFKIFAILGFCVACALLINEIVSLPTYKYKILAENKGYRTNKYEIIGPNCIKFIDRDTLEVIVSGNFEIIENK